MAGYVEFPRCYICKTPYKYNGPEPYLLPCLHSVCKTCLESCKDSTMTCMVCKETFLRTSRARDAVTARDIFLATAKTNMADFLCTNRNDGNEAEYWCQDCEAMLCSYCKASHSEMKSTKRHVLMPLADIVGAGKDCQRKRQCQRHKDHPLTLYDHDCESLLCMMCRVQDHKVCDVGSIDEVYRYLKGQTIPQLISRVTDKMGVNNATEVALQEFDKTLETCRADLKASVRRTFQDLKQVLEEREQDAIQRLDQCLDSLKKENSAGLAEVKLMTERCDTILEFGQKCFDLSTPADVFAMKNTLELRTIACTRSKGPLVRPKACFPMYTKKGLEELRSLLAEYSCISGVLAADGEFNPEDDTNRMEIHEMRLEENPENNLLFSESVIVGTNTTSKPFDREAQARLWRKELMKLEDDMRELQLILNRDEKHAEELRRNLDTGPFRRAMSTIFRSFRSRRSYSVTS